MLAPKVVASPYVLVFEESDVVPTTTNGQSNFRWWDKHRESKRWNSVVFHHVMQHGLPEKPIAKAELILTRFSSVEPDYDGLVSSFKVVIDALRHNRVLSEDKVQNIGRPDYRWEKSGRNQKKIRVEVREIL